MLYLIYIITVHLTHWGRVTHKSTVIGSDNGLSSGWRQAIIWRNAGILLIEPLWTNFSEIFSEIKINPFSFKKMHLKMSSGKWWPFCVGLNVLKSSTRLAFFCVGFVLVYFITTSWHGNIFRISGLLWGEPNGPPVVRLTKGLVSWSFDIFFGVRLN